MSKGNWVQKDANCAKKKDIIPGWTAGPVRASRSWRRRVWTSGLLVLFITSSVMTLFPVGLGAQVPWLTCSLPLATRRAEGFGRRSGASHEQQALALHFTVSRAGLNWSRGRARRNSDHLSLNGGVCVCEMARYEHGDSKWPLEILDICVWL